MGASDEKEHLMMDVCELLILIKFFVTNTNILSYVNSEWKLGIEILESKHLIRNRFKISRESVMNIPRLTSSLPTGQQLYQFGKKTLLLKKSYFTSKYAPAAKLQKTHHLVVEKWPRQTLY